MGSWENNQVGEHEEEDTEFKLSNKMGYNMKEHTVYAIDCRPSMFVADEEDNIPIRVAFEGIHSHLLSKIDTRPNDTVAIVLFNTKEKKNELDRDHIYVLQSLDTPDVSRFKELDMLIKNINIVKDRYGSSDTIFPFSDLLWTCSSLLSNVPKYSFQRVVLISDNDDPTSGNPNYRKAGIQKAKDLKNIGIEIILFGLNDTNREFDKTLFYKDIVEFEEMEGETNVKAFSSTGRMPELLEKLKTLKVTTRSEFQLPLKIGDNLTIGVRGYNMVIERKLGIPTYFYSHQEQVQKVHSMTAWKCVDSDQILFPIEIQKAYAYGGEHVVFNKNEIETLYKFHEPGLLILGFREIKALKAYHQITHPFFIYPDDIQYSSSKAVFFSLLDTLLRKDQMAVCLFVKNKKSQAKIACLLPQQETFDQDGNQSNPPGFQLIILPFADEIRAVPPYTIPAQYEPSRDQFKEIIDKLIIKDGYDPANYHNPFLVNHKNLLRTMALDLQKEDIQFKDETIPDYKRIEAEVSDDVEKFKVFAGLDKMDVDELMNNTPVKRKSSELNEPDKRSKLKEMTIEEHWKEDTLNYVTNPSLKEYLMSVGIQPKKLKADLIAQVHDYLKIKAE